MKQKWIPRGRLCDLAFAYCMGKSFLFRMFFGWRASSTIGCCFILSERAWRELEEFSYYEKKKD